MYRGCEALECTVVEICGVVREMRDELVDAEVVHHGAADHEQVPYGVVWYPEGTLVAHIEGHAGGVQDPSHDEKEQAPWLR